MANFPNNPFPNKVIQQAYINAIGKTFTWSPTYQKFTDSDGNYNYDYHAMRWLKDNKWLSETFDKEQFVYLYEIKTR